MKDRLARLAMRTLKHLHARLPDGAEVTVIIRDGKNAVHAGSGCIGCEPEKLRAVAAKIDREITESN